MWAKTIKIFAFLVCVFGFWFLSFDFASAGWTAGKFGSAISFDGINDYVNSNSSLSAASAFSHSLWFKSSDGSFAADEYLFSQGANDPSVYLESTDNKVKVMADGADKLSSVKTVNNTQWRHLEITADGSTIKLYLDGVLESSASYTGSSAAGILYVASNATPGSYFGGIIDDVKVYSYARTSDEVLTDYNAGKAAHLGKDSQRDDGLVGYWNMEEGKGQTVYDRSGNGNNGTLGASPSVGKDDPVFTSGYSSSGPGGTALKFDGVNDYVVTNSFAISGTNRTFELWMKTPGTVAYEAIVAQNSSVTNTDSIYVNGFHGKSVSANTIYLAVGNGANYDVLQISITPYLNQWIHLVGVIKGSNELRIYINGVSVADKTITISPETVSRYVVMGRIETKYFNGSIDEVRIYNRALSADEIRQHYNQKKPILEMKFDEGSGTSTKDESFNNNDITLVNTPSWLQGKFGSALNFAKTSSQYGYIADNASISLTKDLTISAWVKPASITAATLFDIAGKWDYVSGTARESYLLSQYGDEIRMYVDAAANYKTTNAADLQTDQWYHIEGVYNATAQTVNIYVNGVLQTGTVTGTIPASIGDDVDRFQIAAEDSSTTAANFYDGVIDEAKVYSYARTQAEILTDYNNGLAAHLR